MCENAPSSGQRHAQPVGPVRKLVVDLVERLLQQEEVEQAVGVLRGTRPKPRLVQRLPVGGEESGDRAIAPTVDGARDPAVLVRSRLECTLERRGDGIIERANEPGHVARRWCLATALIDAAARLAFEV